MAQGYDHLLMIAGGVAVSMRDCFLPCSALFCAVLPCSALFCLVCPCLFLSHLSSCSVPRSPPPPLERSHTPHDLVSTITTHVSMQLACAHLMPHTPPLTPPTPFPPLPTYTNIRGLAVNPITFMYAASPNTPPSPPIGRGILRPVLRLEAACNSHLHQSPHRGKQGRGVWDLELSVNGIPDYLYRPCP